MYKLLLSIILVTTMVEAKLDIKAVLNDANLLHSGDIVYEEDAIQFHLTSSDNETLTISYDDNGTYKTLDTLELTKNKTQCFPKGEEQIVFSDKIGLEKFIFTKANKSKKIFVLYHLSKKLDQITLEKLKEINSSATLESIDLPVLSEKRKYTDLTTVQSNARSATDKRVFKELSTQTVIIKTNNELGAGILINKHGGFLTNWHVIRDAGDDIWVAFKPKIGNKPNSNNYYRASVKKVDATKDLALIQLLNTDIVSDKNLEPIALADMTNIEVGEDIFTLGHPVGYYFTLSNGIVANILNDHTWPAKGIQHKANYILKTQNQISAGNSGGPLVNKKLELLGIMTYSDTKGQNLNFAVSSEDIRLFLAKSKFKKNLLSTPSASSQMTDTSYHITPAVSIILDTKVVKNKGSKEIVIIQRLDTNGNGKADIIRADMNRDGNWNRIGYDRNEDGRIDKWQNI